MFDFQPALPTEVQSPLGNVPIVVHTKEMAKIVGCENDNGWWEPTSRLIGIQTDQPETAKLRAIMHEKVHVWLDDWEVSLPADPDGVNRLEESVCTVLGNMLFYEEMLRQKQDIIERQPASWRGLMR